MLSVLSGALSASYSFDQYFTVKKEAETQAELLVVCDDARLTEEWGRSKALIDGVFTARDLLYEPANILYPVEFAKRCTELEAVGLDVQVIDQAQLEKNGYGGVAWCRAGLPP